MKKKRRRLTREAIARWLESRFFLRVHMSLIVVATFLAGLGATKLLLMAGVTSLALRYALAVCAAYLAFLLLIRLWLFYVGIDREIDLTGDGVDMVFATGDTTIEMGGGSFGGGGATGSWGDGPVKSIAAPVKRSSGFSLDLDLDFDAWLVVILFIALVAALLLIGVYLIYTAPALLSEAAFEALLAAALLRRARRIDRPGWVGTVWRATVWPFLGVVVLSAALGWAVRHYCPEATRLRDAWHCRSRRLISSPPHDQQSHRVR